MATIIRPADDTDVPHLEAIETAADSLLVDRFAATVWPPAATGEERAEMPGFLLVASESEGGPAIGFVHVLELDGLAHLEQLAVLPAHGRRGHGRALVVAAMAEAHVRGHASITLRTYVDVPWNAPFCRSCGFVETEPATDFHHQLVQVENELRLDEYGPRVQMTADLPA